MTIMPFIPIIVSAIVYLSLIVGILYLIYRWVSKFIALREEQNDLLREIIDKLESK
ncbi:hypothetical protein [Sunxiuqinia sp. sy24]|uniref:hypothetical protein n=1 Tax=Sunxiuqinia sp. sy24 TaxID=3461495 RepID=UPI0040466ADF